MPIQAQLNAYRDAFNGRDLTAALMLFAEHAVFEMPLLGQRLFGKREIAIGLQRIFEVTESAQIQLSGAKESQNIVIAEVDCKRSCIGFACGGDSAGCRSRGSTE